MKRIHVIAEGRTEEVFVTEVLAREFVSREIYLDARLIGVPGHKGGRVRWQRLRKDIRELLTGDSTAYTTTLFDYFRMGTDFPGYPFDKTFTTEAKREAVENGMMTGLREYGLEDGDLRRFVPYVQMHEFEGILFSDTESLAAGIYRDDLCTAFQAIRNSFDTPEDINNESAPSKRIQNVFPGYQKTVHGPLAALTVTLDAIRGVCKQFNHWLSRLEQVGE